jgi:ubiquinone biosynthesis monooxygenase Coq7
MMPRPFFKTKEEMIDRIIRVNHAGEFGAVRIYSGQIKARKDDALLYSMLAEEKKHFEYFDSFLKVRKIRPTILLPIWDIAGYALGFISAKCSYNTAMLCTEAVESCIEETELVQKISAFRDDEMKHHDTAILNGSQKAPYYFFTYHSIRMICKIAIDLSLIL